MRNKASTLIEMLLVTGILAVIGGVIYNTFSNGLKIWDRGYQLILEEDVAIFFDKINHDLRNSLNYSLINFEGKKDKLTFATIVITKADAKKASQQGQYVGEIGKVEYYFDDIKKHLYRRQANYSQAIDKNWGDPRLLLKDVHKIEFEYFYPHHADYEVYEETSGLMPSLVRIKLEVGGDQNRTSIVKMINVPIGSSE